MSEVSTIPVPDTYDVEELSLRFSDGRGHVIRFDRDDDLSVQLARGGADLGKGGASTSYVVVAVNVDDEALDVVLVQPRGGVDVGAVLGDALEILKPIYERLER